MAFHATMDLERDSNDVELDDDPGVDEGTEIEGEADLPSERPTKPATRMGSISPGILGAVMMGLGEVLDPEKTKPTIEIVADFEASGPGPLDDFEFGDLPALD